MPVLITGGAGFLGSHLAEMLMRKGADVSVLDCVENPWRLQKILDKIQYLQTDLVSWDGSSNENRPFEVVFHLAAFSRPSAAQKEPEVAYRHNVMATANLFQIIRRWPLKKLLFTSAGALYTNVPQYLPIDEKHPIDPSQGIYAMTKRIGEFLCEDFFKNDKVPSIYFRLFNTYGPRQSEEFLIPSFIQQGVREGKITVLNEVIQRDFNYVGDIIHAFLKGAESNYCGGPINLGTGKEYSIGEVARKIGALLGVEVECRRQETFGPTRQLCDNRLAHRILQWQPSFSLEEGLRLTIESFEEHLGLQFASRQEALRRSSG